MVQPQTIIKRLKPQRGLQRVALGAGAQGGKALDDRHGGVQAVIVQPPHDPAVNVAGTRIAPEREPHSQRPPVAHPYVKARIQKGDQPFRRGQGGIGVHLVPDRALDIGKVLQHGLEQPLLVLEMKIRQPDRGACNLGHLCNRGAGQAIVRNRADRGVDQELTPLDLGLRAAGLYGLLGAVVVLGGHLNVRVLVWRSIGI